MHPRAFRAVSIAALMACWPALAPGQPPPSVVRGPYLQGASDSSITLRWRTDLPADSRVRYGSEPGSLGLEVVDPELTTEHEIALTGLAPETRYYYAVGSSSGDLAGGDAEHFFTTAPPAGSRRPLRIWAFGDSGDASQHPAEVRDAFLAFGGGRGADVWLLLGDNAYETGSDADYQANFFDVFGEVLRTTPVWSAFGNHERFSAVSVPEEAGAYYEIFTFPQDGEAGGVASSAEAYYSFDHANVHFISLNSDDPLLRLEGSPMLEWLEADLAANRREWTIAFYHHPPYSRGGHDSDDAGFPPDTPDSAASIREMRERVLPLLEAGGVDLVLTGHNHVYERSFLVDGHYGTSDTLTDEMKLDPGDGRLDGNGPYRKTGDPFNDAHGGAVFAVVGTGAEAHSVNGLHPVMVTFEEVPGSLVVDVDGPRLDAVFIDLERNELDRFTIVRGDPNLPPIARDDRAKTIADRPVTIDLLANDLDPDDDLLLVVAIGAPERGTVTDHGDGTVTYLPDPGFALGLDSFDYSIGDGRGGTASATVTVALGNLDPTPLDDAAETERDLAVRIDLLANDSDPDGDALTVSALTSPLRGRLTDHGDGTVTYHPDPGFTGRDGFGYTASDGFGGAAPARVEIAVACPPAALGGFQDDLEPAPEPGWATDPARNDSPASLTWTVVADPGTAGPNQSWFSDASPASRFKDDRLIAPAQHLYRTSRLVFWHRYRFEADFDGGVLEISENGGATWEDLGTSILANGYDGTLDAANPLGARDGWSGDSPGGGTEMVRVEVDLGAFAGPGRLVRWRLGCDLFTPDDSLGWWIDDVEFTGLVAEPGDCNLPPIALDDAAQTGLDTPVTVSVLANDSDPNNDPLTVVTAGPAGAGEVEIHPDGTVTYTPAPGFSGVDRFPYEISDGALSDSATVTVTVGTEPDASDRARGHGDIDDGAGLARFGFHVKEKRGAIGGWLRLRTLYDGEGSIDLDGRVETLERAGSTAELTGSCWLGDGDPCGFSVRVDDLGHPGAGVDRFAIEVSSVAGEILYEAAGTLLRGHVKLD